MDRGATGSCAIDEEEKGLTRAKRQRLGMQVPIVGDQAARGSTIHVSLQAVSTDGIFATPVLETRQTQNYDEGEARLPAPFCKYIILP